MHGDTDELIAVHPLLHLRWLDITRERRNGVNSNFYIIHELGEIHLLFSKNVYGPAAFRRGGSNPLDGVQVADRFFDAGNDLFLDLLWCRARPGDFNFQAGEPHLRIQFAFHRGETNNAGHEDADHQQVSGDGIPCPPFNQAIHCSCLLVSLALGCTKNRLDFHPINCIGQSRRHHVFTLVHATAYQHAIFGC